MVKLLFYTHLINSKCPSLKHYIPSIIKYLSHLTFTSTLTIRFIKNKVIKIKYNMINYIAHMDLKVKGEKSNVV
jgi:hypothetical protein